MKAEIHFIECKYLDVYEEKGFGTWEEIAIYLPEFGLYLEEDNSGNTGFYLSKGFIEYEDTSILITNMGEL